MNIIAHSDDFRWYGPADHIHEWDHVIKTFNKHGYEVTDASDKEFVGIRMQADENSNYFMDQHRMIDFIINEANISGARDEQLPHPSLLYLSSTVQPTMLIEQYARSTDTDEL